MGFREHARPAHTAGYAAGHRQGTCSPALRNRLGERFQKDRRVSGRFCPDHLMAGGVRPSISFQEVDRGVLSRWRSSHQRQGQRTRPLPRFHPLQRPHPGFLTRIDAVEAERCRLDGCPHCGSCLDSSALSPQAALSRGVPLLRRPGSTVTSHHPPVRARTVQPMGMFPFAGMDQRIPA